MARYASDALDVEYPFRGDALAQPLEYRGVSDTQLPAQARRGSVLAEVFRKCHAANGSGAFLEKQASLSPTQSALPDNRHVEDSLTETFGQRLRRLREGKHFTQAQLGDQCGATHSAVGQWEKHLTSPTMHNLVYIAEVLGVTMDALVWGDDMASGIEARLRRIPKVLRDGLVMRLHQEIDETEKAAKRLPPQMAGDYVKDADKRLEKWSAKNKIKPRKAAKRSRST